MIVGGHQQVGGLGMFSWWCRREKLHVDGDAVLSYLRRLLGDHWAGLGANPSTSYRVSVLVSALTPSIAARNQDETFNWRPPSVAIFTCNAGVFRESFLTRVRVSQALVKRR